MGTRNLTAVYIDGEYKVAQYGQWDGYPEGEGLTCLRFLRDKMDPEKFKAALRNCTYIPSEELSELWRQYGANEEGFISFKDAERMKADHPEYSRDTGAGILELVQNHPDGIKLDSAISFAADSLSCEWAWVVDLDAGTFEGFKGFNTTKKLTPEDRFYFLRDKESKAFDDTVYHGVILKAKWPLDKLPTDEEFLAAFKEDEEPEMLEDSSQQTVTVKIASARADLLEDTKTVKALSESTSA